MLCKICSLQFCTKSFQIMRFHLVSSPYFELLFRISCLSCCWPHCLTQCLNFMRIKILADYACHISLDIFYASFKMSPLRVNNCYFYFYFYYILGVRTFSKPTEIHAGRNLNKLNFSFGIRSEAPHNILLGVSYLI